MMDSKAEQAHMDQHIAIYATRQAPDGAKVSNTVNYN